MLPKIGFSLEAKYDRPMAQVIGLLQKAGFTAVSPVWATEEELSEIAACARSTGMTVQSLHAPPKGMAVLWQRDEAASAALMAAMLASLETCARLQIPVLVVHGWQGAPYTFPGENLYFQNFDRLVAQAEALGVSIAFENLEGEEYLAALLDRYRDRPQVGYCWDSGHDHCYPHSLDFIREFGDRLIMTHLNDNFGMSTDTHNSKDDMHLLPFDGNLDWAAQLRRLRSARRQDTLNFELKTVSHTLPTYPQFTLEQYIAQAGLRARKIAEMYANSNQAWGE